MEFRPNRRLAPFSHTFTFYSTTELVLEFEYLLRTFLFDEFVHSLVLCNGEVVLPVSNDTCNGSYSLVKNNNHVSVSACGLKILNESKSKDLIPIIWTRNNNIKFSVLQRFKFI